VVEIQKRRQQKWAEKHAKDAARYKSSESKRMELQVQERDAVVSAMERMTALIAERAPARDPEDPPPIATRGRGGGKG